MIISFNFPGRALQMSLDPEPELTPRDRISSPHYNSGRDPGALTPPPPPSPLSVFVNLFLRFPVYLLASGNNITGKYCPVKSVKTRLGRCQDPQPRLAPTFRSSRIPRTVATLSPPQVQRTSLIFYPNDD